MTPSFCGLFSSGTMNLNKELRFSCAIISPKLKISRNRLSWKKTGKNGKEMFGIFPNPFIFQPFKNSGLPVGG
jgi:hypothetical protein